ncbi:Lrp/AsnC family transcriptional regulator [Myxococcota bacterium]|nr:Lrp/AsnC family transcriptional regulator [Myxococcota bacterium]
MDRIDARIIELLQADARRTQGDIAQRVGLSQPSVAERIKKLEERGYIRGYTAKVDPRRLGLDITAFVGVGIAHPKYFDSFEKKLAAMPEVQEAHRVAGRDSYLLKIRAQNTHALDEILVGTLRTIPGVTRTQTTIVLQSTKEETFVACAPEVIGEDGS